MPRLPHQNDPPTKCKEKSLLNAIIEIAYGNCKLSAKVLRRIANSFHLAGAFIAQVVSPWLVCELGFCSIQPNSHDSAYCVIDQHGRFAQIKTVPVYERFSSRLRAGIRFQRFSSRQDSGASGDDVPFSPQFHDVSGRQLFAPAGFDRAIESNLPRLNDELGLAAGFDKSVQLQELVEADHTRFGVG
jgi:hypothetical protein